MTDFIVYYLSKIILNDVNNLINISLYKGCTNRLVGNRYQTADRFQGGNDLKKSQMAARNHDDDLYKGGYHISLLGVYSSEQTTK